MNLETRNIFPIFEVKTRLPSVICIWPWNIMSFRLASHMPTSRSYPRHLVKFYEKKRKIHLPPFFHLFKKDATAFSFAFFPFILKWLQFFTSVFFLLHLPRPMPSSSLGTSPGWMEANLLWGGTTRLNRKKNFFPNLRSFEIFTI